MKCGAKLFLNEYAMENEENDKYVFAKLGNIIPHKEGKVKCYNCSLKMGKKISNEIVRFKAVRIRKVTFKTKTPLRHLELK